MKTLDILLQIIQFCDHNSKLASEHQKNNSKNVIVIFCIFCEKYLGTFYM